MTEGVAIAACENHFVDQRNAGQRDPQAGFLENFAARGVLQVFAPFEMAAGKAP